MLHYYVNFCRGPIPANDDGIATFAHRGAIGIIYKENASLSGAEVAVRARWAWRALWPFTRWLP